MDEEQILHGYLAMLQYLDTYYENNGRPDELGGLLGQMSFLRDGGTADPAAWEEWKEAIRISKDKTKEDFLLRIS